jgi:branched-chain amino acid aminotransferase
MLQTQLAASAPKRPPHPDTWILFDGEVVRYHDVRIGPMTHALHYGTGCFEGIRAYWNPEQQQLHLLKADAHFTRLRRSANILRLELPYTNQQMIDWTFQLLRLNDARTDTYVRPLLFIASEQIGVRFHNMDTSFLIYTAPMGDYIPIDNGIRCMTSSWRRIPDAAIPARAKVSGAYVNSALAKSEALENGYDEAIMLTLDGHVSEGSAENLFIIKDGIAVTPPVTDDILEGITRTCLLSMIRNELGLEVMERCIDRSELYTCDELFLCGTGAQVSPVVELDRRKIADGRIGRYTRQLQEVYFHAVRGDDQRYQDWLLPVYAP